MPVHVEAHYSKKEENPSVWSNALAWTTEEAPGIWIVRLTQIVLVDHGAEVDTMESLILDRAEENQLLCLRKFCVYAATQIQSCSQFQNWFRSSSRIRRWRKRVCNEVPLSSSFSKTVSLHPYSRIIQLVTSNCSLTICSTSIKTSWSMRIVRLLKCC